LIKAKSGRQLPNLEHITFMMHNDNQASKDTGKRKGKRQASDASNQGSSDLAEASFASAKSGYLENVKKCNGGKQALPSNTAIG